MIITASSSSSFCVYAGENSTDSSLTPRTQQDEDAESRVIISTSCPVDPIELRKRLSALQVEG